MKIGQERKSQFIFFLVCHLSRTNQKGYKLWFFTRPIYIHFLDRFFVFITICHASWNVFCCLSISQENLWAPIFIWLITFAVAFSETKSFSNMGIILRYVTETFLQLWFMTHLLHLLFRKSAWLGLCLIIIYLK